MCSEANFISSETHKDSLVRDEDWMLKTYINRPMCGTWANNMTQDQTPQNAAMMLFADSSFIKNKMKVKNYS